MAADAMRRFRELHDQLKAQLSDLSQAEQEGEEEGAAWALADSCRGSGCEKLWPSSSKTTIGRGGARYSTFR